MIDLPVPGSIYGMILLFILLCTGVVKIHHVKDVSKFLLDIMPILFVPSAVGIMSEFDQLKGSWSQIIIITIVTTIVTMVVTGKTSQFFINVRKRRSENGDTD